MSIRVVSSLTQLRRWSIRDLLAYKLSDDSYHNVECTRNMLEEIQIRLTIQHARLEGLSNSIKEYANVATLEGEKVQRNLHSLVLLHANTSLLPHQIIESPLLDNFTPRNQKYVADMFEQIVDRHGTAVESISDAVIHARNMEYDLPTIFRKQFRDILHTNNSVIESFLHSRLLIQLLCDHYRLMNKGKQTGAVSLDADILDVISDATTEAKHVADANLATVVAPEVHIIEGDQHLCPSPPIIRPWLHHALVELTKNAMTSTVQKHMQQSSMPNESIPPSVYISIGKEMINDSQYLRINIIDQGLGLKNKKQAFGFAQSSSQKRWSRLDEQQSYASVRQPLGSLGVGLPLSRLMLRVFGGDVDLSNHSKENNIDSGCTATLLINYDDTYPGEN